jgi:type III secretory pathway component EscT
LKLISEQSVDTCKGNDRIAFKTERTQKNTIYLRFLVTQYFIEYVSPKTRNMNLLCSPVATPIILSMLLEELSVYMLRDSTSKLNSLFSTKTK